jgi:Nucleotide-sugar transporter.
MEVNIRIALLIALVLQNSLCAILGRASRTAARPEDLYNINHFITVSECGKFILSLLIECYIQGGFSGLAKSVYTHILKNPSDAVRGSLVPAFLYLISNTLLYIALSNLSAPVFQVLCQFKLITTTIMSVVLFKRLYSRKQWCCIFVLCAGVATVINGEQRQHNAERNDAMEKILGEDHNNKEKDPTKNILIGVTTIGISCLLSSLAGVYFELIVKTAGVGKGGGCAESADSSSSCEESGLKSSTSTFSSPTIQTGPSLWIRNTMLAFFSLIIGTIQGLIQNDPSKSFFHGFNVWVWVQVLLLSCGGLLVAGVIKYADNVVKGLATGISVVLSSSISVLLLGDKPTESFFVGVTLIISSVYLFNNKVKFPNMRQALFAGMLFLAIFPFVFLQIAVPTGTMQEEPDLVVSSNVVEYGNVTFQNMTTTKILELDNTSEPLLH